MDSNAGKKGVVMGWGGGGGEMNEYRESNRQETGQFKPLVQSFFERTQ